MEKYILKEYFRNDSLEQIYQGIKNKLEIDLTSEISGFESFLFLEEGDLSDNEHFDLLKLCRFFMGNLTLYNEETDENLTLLDSVFQNMFVTNDSTQNEASKIIEMVEFIFEFSKFEESEGKWNLYSLLESEFRNNRQFYRNILNEVQQFVTYQATQAYLPAFVHLYRTYEYMSYAFPLTYIQNTNDFYDSYDQLQKFFNDTTSSELAFFDRFLNEIFLMDDYISSELYNQYFEINFQTNNFQDIKYTLQPIINQLENSKIKRVNKILRNNGHQDVEQVIYFDDENSSLIIQALVFHSFIIELRNKIFHFKASRRDSIVPNNIYFEEIFEIVNIHIYNWIAMIFKFILHSALENET